MVTIAMRTHTGHYRHCHHHTIGSVVAVVDAAAITATNEFIHFATSKFIYSHKCFLLLLCFLLYGAKFSLTPLIRHSLFLFLFLLHCSECTQFSFISKLVPVLPYRLLHFPLRCIWCVFFLSFHFICFPHLLYLSPVISTEVILTRRRKTIQGEN